MNVDDIFPEIDPDAGEEWMETEALDWDQWLRTTYSNEQHDLDAPINTDWNAGQNPFSVINTIWEETRELRESDIRIAFYNYFTQRLPTRLTDISVH